MSSTLFGIMGFPHPGARDAVAAVARGHRERGMSGVLRVQE